SFVLQMADYLQQNYPSEWNKSEIQEIYNQLSSEMSQWKPLVQYNSSAQFFTLYSDSPINVNSDGYFEADVPVQSNDNTAAFEVVLNDGEHFSVNRTSFADLITSTGGGSGELKSCSRSVYALPGGISIFKVFASINLKESGLSFSLNDSSSGVITPTFYLKIKGQENFNIGYGVFKAKQEAAAGMGKTGTITASTSSNGVSGQNIPMPVEIVHETVSISGKVFTDGSPLIDGHVKSIGPKSFCHLDAEGNYVLPEVFEGTNREVIATWWTDESGKRTKHVEIKYIDFLNGNLTDFNFGVPPTPTPTPSMTSTSTPSSRPFTDQDFYDSRVGEVIWKRYDWIKNFGREQGLEMTLEWLNGNLTDAPPIPKEIVQATRGSDYIRIYFQSGYTVVLYDPIEDPNTLGLPGDENIQSLNSQLSKPDYTMTEELYSSLINASDSVFSGTLKNKKILILAPYATLNGTGSWAWDKRVYGDLGYYLENVTYGTSKVYDVTRVATIRYIDFEKYTIDNDDPNSFLYPTATPLPGGTPTGETVKLQVPVIKLRKTNPESKNLLRPEHFENLSDYGIIFIYAHARDDGGFSLSLAYEDDLTDPYSTDMGRWLLDHNGEWEVGYRDSIMNPPPDYPPGIYSEKCLDIKGDVFRRQNYNNSLVYLYACTSWIYHKSVFYDDRARGAEVFLGFSGIPDASWGPQVGYHFFCYMIFGEANMPSVSNPDIKPMSAYQTCKTLSPLNQDPEFGTILKIAPEEYDTHVYFPSPIGIKIHKK
ncbi:MAG: hypothetical protein ABRQ39_27090, partial [Candidatus Eremiobacterota bacterium]